MCTSYSIAKYKISANQGSNKIVAAHLVRNEYTEWHGESSIKHLSVTLVNIALDFSKATRKRAPLF